MKRLAVLGLAFVLALLAAEAALRIRQKLRYGTFAPTVYETYRDPATGLRLPRPGSRVGPIRINRLGFRGPELAVPKPPDRVRLAFLGGSTTFCAEVSREEATWPHRVWAALVRRFPRCRFDYLNAAAPGFTVRESLIHLRRHVLPLQPDVVIIYHAVNDFTVDTRRLATAQGLWEGAPDEPSWLGRVSLLWFLVEKNWKVWRRQRAARAQGPHLDFDARALAAAFARKLTELVRAAGSRGALVVLLTFCHRVRPDQSPEEQLRNAVTALYYAPYLSLEGLVRGMAAYNEAIRQVAAQTGALLVETAEAVPPDGEHFTDSVHLTDAGAARLAAAVVAGLTAAPAWQRRVRSCR